MHLLSDLAHSQLCAALFSLVSFMLKCDYINDVLCSDRCVCHVLLALPTRSAALTTRATIRLLLRVPSFLLGLCLIVLPVGPPEG